MKKLILLAALSLLPLTSQAVYYSKIGIIEFQNTAFNPPRTDWHTRTLDHFNTPYPVNYWVDDHACTWSGYDGHSMTSGYDCSGKLLLNTIKDSPPL